MKIIQISGTDKKIYGLSDEGVVYEMTQGDKLKTPVNEIKDIQYKWRKVLFSEDIA